MLRLSLLTIAACASAPHAPAPRMVATGGAPCFPDRAALDAPKVYEELEKYAWSLYASADDPPIPDGMYGTCKVSRNVVSAKDGTVVAELGCGVRILVPGIRDELGLQLGARGSD